MLQLGRSNSFSILFFSTIYPRRYAKAKEAFKNNMKRAEAGVENLPRDIEKAEVGARQFVVILEANFKEITCLMNPSCVVKLVSAHVDTSIGQDEDLSWLRGGGGEKGFTVRVPLVSVLRNWIWNRAGSGKDGILGNQSCRAWIFGWCDGHRFNF